MYNGIGLATPRGSGTNGFVQRNLALSYKTKEKGNFKAPNEIATPSLKKPNTDIIEHDRKRKIEVKCLEFQSMLEDQGCTEEEIDKRVQTYRESLLGESAKEARDKHGRIIVKETHEIAEAQQRKNEKLREAFGISEYFVEGSSFDPERHAKEAAAKAALEETQKYALIPSPPSSDDESAQAEKPAESSKSKKKKKASASPPDPSTSNVKKKKKKKHKRKSESPSDEEKVSSRHKSKAEKDAKKKRHVSASPTKPNKHRKRNDESSEVELKKTKKKKPEKHTEVRSHKSRISRSSSPYRSEVESDNYESSRKKKRPDSTKTADKRKRSSSPRSKARAQEANSSSAAEYDRKKKRSSPRCKSRKHDRDESPPPTAAEHDRKKKYPASGRSRARKRDKSGSRTPDSSAERSSELEYRDEAKKHSRNRSKEKRRTREKEAAPRKRHRGAKRKPSPVDSDEDDFSESKMPTKGGKTGGGKEKSRKKVSPDRRAKRRSSSAERRRGAEHRSEPAKRKRRESSSEREVAEKRSRRDASRDKSTRKREASRDKHAKPFYGKKTRLTVSDSESERSSSSPDRRKAKSKPNHKSTRNDVDARFGSGGAAKHRNRLASRRDSDSEPSAEESKPMRENRRAPYEKSRVDSSKTPKNYVCAEKSKSVRNDGEKSRAEGAKPSPLVDRQPEVAARTATPGKVIDGRRAKTVIDAQRNGVEAAAAVENGVNVDGSVANRDSSTSSSLSYSPMEKYPHRYKDILADASKKGQKSDLSLRRSEIKDRSSPVQSDDRSKKETEVKVPDAKEKAQSVMAAKNAAPAVGEAKSENLFCLSEVPLPPVGGSSSATKLPALRDAADVAAESPRKAAKLIDSTSALVKSIPPALSQKPNTLAASISDVIAKSMQKRDVSSSSESLRKRKSRSSSKSSSSSDSSLSSRKRSGSDSSSSSSRSSSRGSNRRRRSRKNSSSSDPSSSSSSSDSSRSRSRGRSATKNKRKKKKRGTRSASHSDSRSYSSSYSSSRSRSISIPRRKGSPSFLERRRITSRKRRRRSRSSSSRQSSSS